MLSTDNARFGAEQTGAVVDIVGVDERCSQLGFDNINATGVRRDVDGRVSGLADELGGASIRAGRRDACNVGELSNRNRGVIAILPLALRSLQYDDRNRAERGLDANGDDIRFGGVGPGEGADA